MQLDPLYLHNDDVSEASIGEFYGTKIRSVDPDVAEERALLETLEIVEQNKAFGISPSYLEVLPGEAICEDAIVRRTTTAEAQGEVFYDYELPPSTHKASIEDAKKLSDEGHMVTWRPDRAVNKETEFAIIHEE